MLTVKQLNDDIGKLTPSLDSVVVGDFQFNTAGPTGDCLVNKNTGEIFGFTEDSFKNFSKYLGIPPYFAEKLPPSILGQVVDHFIEVNREKPATMSHFGEEFHNLFDSKSLLLPPNEVMSRVVKIFNPEDVVSHLDFINGLVINVRTINVEKDILPGDITQGGIRFNATYGAKPQVSAYMERLVCSNGMVATNELDVVPLRGFTLNEVLANVEHMAEHYLKSLLPNYLENWKKMTTITSTNPEQLIHRLARENDLSTKLESHIIDAASSLSGSSYYDVVNLITSFQHADGVDANQSEKLRQLGGNAVRDLGGHRCTSCQHNLD